MQVTSGVEEPGCRRQSLVLLVSSFSVAAAVASHSRRADPGWTDKWSNMVAVWKFMSISCHLNTLRDVCFPVPLCAFASLKVVQLIVALLCFACAFLSHCAFFSLHFTVQLPHAQLSC